MIALALAAVLDLAFASGDRLIALRETEVELYRVGAGAPQLLENVRLPPPSSRARSAAGLLHVDASEGTVWALTNLTRATLFALEGDRLVERLRAEALPWPGLPSGLRYREGTNLLELPEGPLRALRDGAAVADDGSLRLGEQGQSDAPRVGAALAPLDAEWLVASSAAPPGGADALLLLRRQGPATTVAETRPIKGSIEALAARRLGSRIQVVVAISHEGSSRFATFELRVPGP